MRMGIFHLNADIRFIGSNHNFHGYNINYYQIDKADLTLLPCNEVKRFSVVLTLS